MYYTSSPAIIACSWLCVILSIIFVGLRYYCRFKFRLAVFGYDDYALGFALFLFMLQQAVLIDLEMLTDYGKHIKPETMQRALIQMYVYHLCFAHVNYLSKLALFLLYRRLLAGLFMKRTLIASGLLLGISWVVCGLITGVPMRPFKDGDPYDVSHLSSVQRLHYKSIVYVFGPLDALTSLVLTALPFALLRKLQINQSDKTALLVIFSLGILCLFATVFRWVLLWNLASANSYILWTAVQESTLMIVQSMMVLRPLLMQILVRLGLRPDGRVNHNDTAPYTSSGSTGMMPSHHYKVNHNEISKRSFEQDCSSWSPSDSTAKSMQQERLLDLQQTRLSLDSQCYRGLEKVECRSPAAKNPWSAIQIEQTFTHSFDNMSRAELSTFNRTEVFAGQRTKSRHPVKAKSLTSIIKRQDSYSMLRSAATMPQADNARSILPVYPPLKLVP